MPISKLRPSFTFTEDRLAELRAVVPEAFADGKINWDALREALGEHLEDEATGAEHFGLFWPGKQQARRLAAMPSKGSLIPVPGDGVDEDTTHNAYIEGDNLEVLKLLQKSYAGRVKVIYIDPPYNTGNDLIYVDDFGDTREGYLRKSGQMDDSGELLVANPKSSGRFHSKWLSMIYPRLLVARNLLAIDGVIFISIDDNEVDNLKKVCDEVFGDENFVGRIVVQSNPRGSQSVEYLALVHEYLLVYAKSYASAPLRGVELSERMRSDYASVDERTGQRYRLLGLRQRGGAWRRSDRPSLYFAIYIDPQNGDISLEPSARFSVEVLPFQPTTGEEGSWRWSREKIGRDRQYLLGRRVNRKGSPDAWDVFQMDFLQSTDGRERTTKVRSIWDDKELNYQNGATELKELFGRPGVFDFPKPVALVKRALSLVDNDRDLVLDFFSGSATAAHAVLELNSEDGGNRSFIMVQLPEATDSPQHPTIAEIGKERIRRVIKKIRANRKGELKLGTAGSHVDLGFRVFKLNGSSFSLWHDYSSADLQQLELLFESTTSPLVDGWEPNHLLTEIQLLEGFQLDSSVTEMGEYKKNEVMLVESDLCAHRLFVCLDKRIKDDTLERLDMRPNDVFVCLDSALTDEAKVRLGDLGNLRVI